MSIVTINSDILRVLRESKIDSEEAKLYLLGVYFNVNTQYISENTRKQVNALGIVEREYTNNASKHRVVWNVPLFNEEKDEEFGWVEKWMDGFKNINPARRGTKSSVKARMKKFFATHPHVRVEDVFSATQLYFKTVNDPQYLKTSHKFIYEGTGFKEVSHLEQYIEQLKASGIRDGRDNKMKA